MEVHASLRRLRMSPRKVRLVIDVVRGLPVLEAETRLTFLQKSASRPVLKLLKSAIANAEHNFKLDRADLVVAKITADGGPTYHRFTPRAFGRAAPIRKRTTHISLTLVPKNEIVQSPSAAKKALMKSRRTGKPKDGAKTLEAPTAKETTTKIKTARKTEQKNPKRETRNAKPE